MFARIGERIRDFMIGRNGSDQLAWALFVLGIVLEILGSVLSMNLFTLLAYIPLIFAVFRVFSRNIEKRQQENQAFTQFFARIRGRRDYAYFKCPACKTRVRVPRGKGKIRITCPSCREKFEKKT